METGFVQFFNFLIFYSSGVYSQFSAEIADHQFYFQVISASESCSNPIINERNLSSNSNNFDSIDTFTLQLPRVCANGSYKSLKNCDVDLPKRDGWNGTDLVYRNEGYYNITILISNIS